MSLESRKFIAPTVTVYSSLRLLCIWYFCIFHFSTRFVIELHQLRSTTRAICIASCKRMTLLVLASLYSY
jgi:hypothetical protein